MSERRSEQPPVFLVGVGVTAQAIEPLKLFLEALPAAPGMAFLILTPRDGEMSPAGFAGIVRNSAKSPVVEVRGPTRCEADHIYLIPNDKRLVVSPAGLDLASFDGARDQAAPIDQFFRSLASDEACPSGILFSADGGDGIPGLQAIKGNGGLVLAVSPEDAAATAPDGVALGVADFQLSAKDVAAKLLQVQNTRVELPLDPDRLPEAEGLLLQRILGHVRTRLGHDFSAYKRSTILRRMARRLLICGCRDLSGYLDFLQKNPEESNQLFQDLLIGVTSFFREPEIFQNLRERVIPALFHNLNPSETIRVWSAGCSTGEEAYSLAILLVEQAENVEFPTSQIQIFASDIDERALSIAREGTYPDAIEADVSENRLKRFFVKFGRHYRVTRELRDITLFAAHNLLRDPPFSRIDLIACRNFLIYLQRETQEQVFATFRHALRPGRYLLLGNSETPPDNNWFRVISSKSHIYQANPARERYMPAPRLPQTLQILHRPPAKQISAVRDLHRQMLEDHAPPNALVRRDGTVLHLSSRMGRYLLPQSGPITSDLIQLIRPELQLTLRSTLHQAFESAEQQTAKRIRVRFNGQSSDVRLAVSVGPGEGQDERVALVMLIEEGVGYDQEPLKKKSESSSSEVLRLEEELRGTQAEARALRETYNTATEELRAAIEELQSTNEEYRATTEELETSKEELQSINEELQTVNSELRSSLEELSKTNADLENFTSATEIATLFLDSKLQIRRFTPTLVQVFNIRRSDIGRPIGDLAHHLDYDELESDAKAVLTRPHIQREVRSKNGRWFSVRASAYYTHDNRIDGAVLSFVDISELKANSEKLQHEKERAQLLLDTVRQGLLLLDSQFAIQMANDRFLEILGVTPRQITGVKLQTITEANWDGSALFEALAALRDKREAFRDVEVRQKIGGAEARVLVADGRLLNHSKMILVAVEDETEKRRAAALHQSNKELEKRVRERTQQVRALASQVARAENEERHRVAQVLHDELQQILYAVQIRLTLLFENKASPLATEEQMKEAGKWIEKAIRTTRELTVNLSPPVLEDEGLTHALRWLGGQIVELYGVQVEVIADEDFRLRKDIRVLLFQAVRELLFNVVKHSEGDRAQVRLTRHGDLITVECRDEGKGFDKNVLEELGETGSAFGLSNLRQRLDLFDGTVQIDTEVERGARVVISASLDSESASRRPV